jgi:hypothetical protein
MRIRHLEKGPTFSEVTMFQEAFPILTVAGMDCHGGQGEVMIWNDLLIRSWGLSGTKR